TPAAVLPWLEAPNPQALANANALLTRWELLDGNGSITRKGRLVAQLGTHPRIAALLLHGEAAPGWWLMALALHFDLPLENSLDDWLQTAAARSKQDGRWRKMARRWQRVLDARVTPAAESIVVSARHAATLAGVMADRLGHRSDSGKYRL